MRDKQERKGKKCIGEIDKGREREEINRRLEGERESKRKKEKREKENDISLFLKHGVCS